MTQACVALEVAVDQVGRLDAPPNSGANVRASSAEQLKANVIDVGEQRGESAIRLELVDSAEALSAQHQARAILGQFGKERFVVGSGQGVEFIDEDRHVPSLLGRTCSLLANRQRDLIYQGAAYERGDVGADRFLGPVDNHHRTVAHHAAGSIVERDCPTIARGRARGEFVDLCLYRVDHLQTEAPIERLEERARHTASSCGSSMSRREAIAEGVVFQNARTSRNGVLAVLPPVGSVLTILRFASTSACRAIRNTSSMRGPQKRSNSCLNTRSALPTSRSSPTRPNIEQVQPERPPTCAHVQVDDVTVPASRHHAERGSREIAVRSTSTTVGASRPSAFSSDKLVEV